jgi:sterol desaturase/sphingolipid hydroxylase (fatty acid hydroxylase superfamily)
MWNLDRYPRGIRLFENPVLDALTRIHPVMVAVVWIPAAAVMFVAGLDGLDAWSATGWACAGFVGWFVAEYVIHRWFFHFHPRSVRLARLFYYIHEHHHRYLERDRLVAPPLMSAMIYVMLLGVFSLALGLPLGFPVMWAFMAGVSVGYVVYDYVHLYMHVGRPTSRLGRYMQRCHQMHHGGRSDCWYSVSLPWFDYVWGTAPRRTGSGAPREHHLAREAHGFRDDELPPLVREYERHRREHV